MSHASTPRGTRRAIPCALVLLPLGLAGTVHADTTVGGPVFSDTTWDLAGSPYIVTSSVVVGVDATLTIDPGVEVRIDPGLGIQIGSDGFGGGALVARGTVSDPILFTSSVGDPDLPAPGDWNTIDFTTLAENAEYDGGGAYLSGSILEHVIVEFGGGGATTTGSITIQQSSPALIEVEVRDSARSGLRIDGLSTPPLRIEDCTFRRCQHTGNGGGLYLTGGAGHEITGCLFDDNSASQGGGAYVDAAAIVVDSCTFTGNAGSSNGGGLRLGSASGSVTTCTFTGNTASSGGGAIISSFNNGTLQDCTFDGNAATSGGGGLYHQSGTASMLLDNDFTSNTANGFAGGVYLAGSGITFSGNLVTGNSCSSGSSDGGGLYVQASTTSVVDATITGNTTQRHGGGLYVAAGSATISSSTISDNDALTGSGGGVFQSSSGGSYAGCTISLNDAGGAGGGVYVNTSGTSTSFSDCMVTDNEATVRGGGFAWRATGGSLAGVNGGVCNTITGNVAPIGSAVDHVVAFAGDGSGDLDASYACWGTTDYATIATSVFDYFDDGTLGVVRLTPYEGGPILVDTTWTAAGGPYVVSESVILGGDATLTIEPGVVVEVTPGKSIVVGGAAFGPSCLEARGTALDPILFTSSLPSGEQGPGDWVHLYFGSGSFDATFDPKTGDYLAGCILEHVIVEFAGGGSTSTGSVTIEGSSPYLHALEVRDSARTGVRASVAGSPAMRIEDCTFRRCQHTGNGGGLYLLGGSEHRVTGCTFDDNAGSQGAGAYLDGTQIRVEDCTFTGNDASSNGGGMRLASANGIVRSCSFTGNEASSGGGAIISSFNTGLLELCTFDGNSASSGGGGLYLQSGTAAQVLQNTFTGNVASGFAGGMYSAGSGHLIDDCLFDANDCTSGSSDGGGLYVQSSATDVVDATITGNSATRNGGGLYVAAGTLEVRDSVIMDNSADTGLGGGVFVASSGGLYVNTEIADNFAGNAGGGCFVNTSGTGTTFAESRITMNQAVVSGGGLYWQATGGSLAGDAVDYNVIAGNVAGTADAVYYTAANGNDLPAQNVCWGLFDGGAITSAIHDFFDDASLGFVFFVPFIEDPGCAGGAEPCPTDLDDDGVTGFEDLLVLLAGWGPCPGCPADLDADDLVGFEDLLILLAGWGDCP